jgi:mono/diheme cytochrome c family protein
MLAAWESGPYADLQTALKKHDKPRATAALTGLRQQCVNCHTVLGKTQIQVPEIQ